MTGLAKVTRRLLAALLAWLVMFNAADAGRLDAQLIRTEDGVPLPAFDVASVKQNNSGSDGTHVLSKDARYSVENLPLREILKIAYGAKSDAQITGRPAAVLRNRYDIEAKIDEEQFAQIKTMSSEDHRRQIGLMLQTLLADRISSWGEFSGERTAGIRLGSSQRRPKVPARPLLRRQAIRASVAARTPKKLRAAAAYGR